MDTVALFVDVDSFCQNLPDAAGLRKAATVGRATPAPETAPPPRWARRPLGGKLAPSFAIAQSRSTECPNSSPPPHSGQTYCSRPTAKYPASPSPAAHGPRTLR